MKTITNAISSEALQLLHVEQLLSTKLTDLSEKTGINRVSLGARLHGKTRVSIAEFVAISNALGLDPAQVLKDAEKKATESKEASDGND